MSYDLLIILVDLYSNLGLAEEPTSVDITG